MNQSRQVIKASKFKPSRKDIIEKTVKAAQEEEKLYEKVIKELLVSDSESEEVKEAELETTTESIVATKKTREPTTFMTSKGEKIDNKKKYRRFCFTWNNYPEDWQDRLTALQARYLIAGKEVAPSTKTKHLQGYCEFDKQYRIAEFAKLVWEQTCVIANNRGSGISHFEPAIGDCEANVKYCSKEDTEPYEYGDQTKKGGRSDIKIIKDKISKGATMGEIIDEVTSYQSIKMAEKILQYKDKKRTIADGPMNVIWIYGYSGTGKTYDSLKEYPNAYVKGNNLGKWYDGYDGEREMILDEFRGTTMKYSELLGLLQPYEFRVEHKGGSRQMRATTIVITSCFSPIEIYAGIDENREQLYRRINEVRYYSKTGKKEKRTLNMEDTVDKRAKEIIKFCNKHTVQRDEIEMNLLKEIPESEEEEIKKENVKKITLQEIESVEPDTPPKKPKKKKE